MIYGNCQAEFLGLLLSHVPSLTSRFSFVVVPYNVEPGAPLPAIAPEIDRAVLLWEQYNERAGVTLRDRMRERLPGDCRVMRYPALVMTSFWPFIQKDRRSQPEPGYPWGRYPLGDRVAAEVADLGLPPGRAFERYMELSVEKMPDVRQLLARDRTVLAQRDDACEVTIGDYVTENLQSTYQFWARAHLATPVISELLVRLLERSRNVLGDLSEVTRRELRAAGALYPGQGEFQLPIHPLVIERLGLRFADANTKYLWFGNWWTFEEQMTRYIAFDREW